MSIITGAFHRKRSQSLPEVPKEKTKSGQILNHDVYMVLLPNNSIRLLKSCQKENMGPRVLGTFNAL